MKTNHLLAMTLPLLAIVFAMSCNPNKPQEPTSYEDAKTRSFSYMILTLLISVWFPLYYQLIALYTRGLTLL